LDLVFSPLSSPRLQNPSVLVPRAAAAAAAMDKSMLGDLDSLPEEDKMRMAAMVDQLQIRDRFGPYERIPDILLPVSLATSRCWKWNLHRRGLCF